MRAAPLSPFEPALPARTPAAVTREKAEWDAQPTLLPTWIRLMPRRCCIGLPAVEQEILMLRSVTVALAFFDAVGSHMSAIVLRGNTHTSPALQRHTSSVKAGPNTPNSDT